MAVEAHFALLASQDSIDHGFYHSYLQLHQRNLHLFQNNQFKNQNLPFPHNIVDIVGVSDSSSPFKVASMLHSQTMPFYDDKQTQDLDHYISLQNDRLRLLLEQQRKQQLASLMKRIETKAVPLLKQRDEEIRQADKRRRELEDILKRLEVDNQAWQREAKENEAMVISLNKAVDQLRGETASCCCDNDDGGAEDAGSSDMKGGIEERGRGREYWRMVCRGCKSRNSCILLLPCRHLCSCKDCEPFLDSCPVCQTVKKASMEVLI